MDTSQPPLDTLVMNHGIHISEIPGKGRGVFASRNYHFEDIIEICPVILFHAEEIPLLDKTSLYHYYYDWERADHKAALALGYGSLYNHSYNPNAMYLKDLENNLIYIQCLHDIMAGEEITINYNCNPHCRDPLWFNVLE